ncbi:MAG: GAF domain-containing protein, partial [Planctomycetota bacterium]
MPQLEIRSPTGERSTIELTERPIRFGRADECDVVLRHDAEVSRVHAEVRLDPDGRILVIDKGSKNGTRVDEGEVFRGASSFASRTIRIGEHEIAIIGAAAPAAVEAGAAGALFSAEPVGGMGDTQFFPSTRGFDLNQQRLSLLIRLTERIGGVFERKQLLEEALDACCDALGFERGLVVLKTQRGDTELPVSRNMQRDETGAFKVSRTIINRALLHGERAVVNNPATDLEGNLSESLMRFPICSALCVPIMNRNEILGVMYGDRITQGSIYTPADVDFLAAIAQQVGVGLTNLQLFREHMRSQAMYAELERARVIQRNLLPAAPLLLGRAAMHGFNEPSSEVSGDYFDYFALDQDRIGFIIADVTGHGLPAALIMANVQAAVRVALSGDADLVRLAERVNRLLCSNTSTSVFITGILGILDARSGDVQFVCAGHPGPLLIGDGDVQEHDGLGSLPLGIDPEERFGVQSLSIAGSHPTMMFYTDGLIEAEDGGGRLLGVQAVAEAL